MSNSSTEKCGILAVLEHEKNVGGRPNWKRVHGCGYDLVTSSPAGDERHIEVKSTAKKKFVWRWLEQKEYEALQNDERFWVYLVTDATSASPTVRELSPDEMKKRFKGEIRQYKFDFS